MKSSYYTYVDKIVHFFRDKTEKTEGVAGRQHLYIDFIRGCEYNKMVFLYMCLELRIKLV